MLAGLQSTWPGLDDSGHPANLRGALVIVDNKLQSRRRYKILACVRRVCVFRFNMRTRLVSQQPAAREGFAGDT